MLVRLRTTSATGPRALGARLAVEEREERAALQENKAGLGPRQRRARGRGVT